jgi:hypothetical protein
VFTFLSVLIILLDILILCKVYMILSLAYSTAWHQIQYVKSVQNVMSCCQCLLFLFNVCK